MSEEEIIKTLNYQLKMKDTDVYTPINYDAIQGLLDLYTKQQKVIEELKHDNSILCEIAYTGKRIQLPYTMVYTGTDNFISKDIIRKKLEKIEELYCEKVESENFEYNNNQFIVDFIALVEELFEV